MTDTGVDQADLPDAQAVLDHDSSLRFLLIEDSASDSALILDLLEDEFSHTEIDTATSLERALVLLAERSYDLILADLSLPDADGGTVVRTIRRAFPHTTLMVLTGRVDGTLALWALAEGAQDYLVKGQHDGPRLAQALLQGLQRSRTEQDSHAVLVAALTQESEGAERLRELNNAKGDFVATVSHELRTPLTSISAYAEMLQEESGLTARQIGFVNAIARNAARLGALTDDLLLLSGFSSRQLRMQSLEVDLRVVVSHVEEILLILGAGRDISVEFVFPEVDALVVMGDIEHLERVVLNLMSNAIKFSEDGGTVICRLTHSATRVFLEVIDTGIGIPEDEQSQLFTRFFRGAAGRERAIQGTGLGLHIVASIVRNHGGEISVESGGDTPGSTFTVSLPRVGVSGPEPG